MGFLLLFYINCANTSVAQLLCIMLFFHVRSTVGLQMLTHTIRTQKIGLHIMIIRKKTGVYWIIRMILCVLCYQRQCHINIAHLELMSIALLPSYCLFICNKKLSRYG